MKIVTTFSVGITTCILLGAGAADAAVSETLPAMSGHAWIASDQSCFESSWALVRNACPTTKKLLIAGRNPVQSGFPAVATFSASAENDPARTQRPLCRTVVNDAGNGLIGQTGLVPVEKGPGLTTLGSVFVGSNATFHFDCDITANASSGIGLTQVQWSTASSPLNIDQFGPPNGGHAWFASDSTCFSTNFNGVRNLCTSARKWLAPAYINSLAFLPRNYHFRAAGENLGNATAGPQCRSVVNDAASGFVSQTGVVTVAKNAQTLLGTIPIFSASNTAHFDCDIVPESQAGYGLSMIGWVPQASL